MKSFFPGLKKDSIAISGRWGSCLYMLWDWNWMKMRESKLGCHFWKVEVVCTCLYMFWGKEGMISLFGKSCQMTNKARGWVGGRVMGGWEGGWWSDGRVMGGWWWVMVGDGGWEGVMEGVRRGRRQTQGGGDKGGDRWRMSIQMQSSWSSWCVTCHMSHDSKNQKWFVFNLLHFLFSGSDFLKRKLIT